MAAMEYRKVRKAWNGLLKVEGRRVLGVDLKSESGQKMNGASAKRVGLLWNGKTHWKKERAPCMALINLMDNSTD